MAGRSIRTEFREETCAGSAKWSPFLHENGHSGYILKAATQGVLLLKSLAKCLIRDVKRGRIAGMKWRLLITVLVAGTALYSQANLSEPGFEGNVVMGNWVGPWGHGALGGHGSGSFVDGGSDDFVRSGDRSLRLTVSDDGNPNAVAWAGISQTQKCMPGSKVRAGAWIYSSPDHHPPTEGRAMAQLRLEYFEDDYAEYVIPTHISLSTPFTSTAGYEPDTWHLIQLYDRVPDMARTVKFSILLLSQQPNHQPKMVWVDDAFLEFQGPRYKSRYTDFEGYIN